LSRAREMAQAHAELGLSEIFLADNLNPARKETPGRGVDFDQERLARVADVLGAVAEVFHGEGILACLHQHTASWVETEDELRFVLDRVDAEILGAGPDVAHLAWAGADPVQVIESLGERVRVAHLKDLHLDVVHAAAGLSYRETVAAGAYTEPGRGDLDLDACVAALKRARVGWAVLEVDQPDHLSPEESARRCAIWAADHK
jgi:inosose dehydratase